MSTKKILFMALLAFAVALPAVSQQFDGKTIKEVRIQGLERVSEQLIRSQLEVQAGQTYNQVAISRDIRRLSDTTFFSSIKADATLDGEQVVISYLVEEKRVISEIKIIGNDKIKERAIRGAVSWREGDTFLEDGYDEEREAILNLYQSKGIANTTVDIVVEEVGPSRVRITYMVDEGKKARIRSVDFEGNDALSDRQLRKGMQTKRRWWFFGGKYDEDKFEADLQKVLDKYGDHGRLEAAVAGTEIAYSDSGKGMDIVISVAEGPEYKVGTIETANNVVFDDDEILKLLKVQAGDVHNKGQVQKDSDLVAKGYADSGYVNAGVTPQVTLDKESTTTNIVYRTDEGDLKYVGEIKVTGNDVTRDDVIRRDIFVVPGERFDGTLLEASKRRLESTDYYEAIRFSMENIEENDRFANLLVDVDEGRTGFWNFGAGYSTDDGFGGYTELRFNNFDITNWPTFSGGGQQFRIRLNLGQRRNEYNLSFTDPEFMGYPILFGVDLFDESYEYEGGSDYTQETSGGQLRLGKVLSPYVTARTAVSYRSVNYSDMETGPFSAYYPYIGGDVTISSIWGINRTTTDNSRDPSKGARHDLQLEIAGIGGDNNFWKIDHDSTWFWALDEESKWVLSYRSRQGIGSPWGDSDVIPLSDRYFVGGSSTVRGYDSRDIGPTRPRYGIFGDDESVGGELRLVNNLEIKYKWNKWFRLYGFLDAGGVWLEPSDFGFGDMKYGAGVGIGFDVPRMGPIRVDIGMPLNGDEDQDGPKVHLQGGFRF
ncbi:MAG: outer membrane protein assembly factor BamA [Candidatus Hydrogenedentes bacterium]|nr:outer membrane protein assembly factor BamA [Candidatus Hydrogenedentota bacterium]